MEKITIDTLKTADLRVARIESAERVEGSEKLLKLRVSLGDEERQIIAGIGATHEPNDLVGREIVVVANLAPRMMMGLESQGMLLAATDEEGRPVLIAPTRDVPPGTPLR